MIDHEITRYLNIDLVEVLAQSIHRRAHRGKIDDHWYTGEILEHDAGRFERDLGTRILLRFPGENLDDVLFGNPKSIDVSERALQENADRVRQPLDVACPETIQSGQIVVSDLTQFGVDCFFEFFSVYLAQNSLLRDSV